MSSSAGRDQSQRVKSRACSLRMFHLSDHGGLLTRHHWLNAYVFKAKYGKHLHRSEEKTEALKCDMA